MSFHSPTTQTEWQRLLAKASMTLEERDIYSTHSKEDRRQREKSVVDYGDASSKPAAVLVALTMRRDSVYLVLTRRSARLTAHRGEISFPGGKIETLDQGPVCAALREAREEIGIANEQVSVLGKLPKYETGTGFTISPITAVISPPYSFVRQQEEVEEIFEVPMSHILTLTNYKKKSLVLDGVKRSFWSLPYKDYYIWGATAAILIDLADRITKAQINNNSMA